MSNKKYSIHIFGTGHNWWYNHLDMHEVTDMVTDEQNWWFAWRVRWSLRFGCKLVPVPRKKIGSSMYVVAF